jgi:hypothetical protein
MNSMHLTPRPALAEVLRDAVNARQPPLLADVVGEQVARAVRHGSAGYRVVKERYAGAFPASTAPSRRAWIPG